MDTLSIIYISAEVIFGILSLVGNLIVVIAILRTRYLHTVPNVFLGSLAMADIIVGLFVAPLAVLSYKGMPRNFYGCVFINSVLIIFTNVSILMLLAVALDRFMAIKNPFAYHRLMTIRRAFCISFYMWLLGILCGLIPVFGWNSGKHEITFCRFTEVITFEFMVYSQFFGFFVVPMLMMLCIYIYIIIIVRRHTKKMRSIQIHLQNTSREGEEGLGLKAFRQDVHTAKMFAIVIVVFGLFWLPLNIFNCISLFCGPKCKFPYEALLVAIVMSHANSSVNPIIYAGSNSRFREAIKRLFICNRKHAK